MRLSGMAGSRVMEIWLISAGFSFVPVKCYTMLRLRISNRIGLAECAR